MSKELIKALLDYNFYDKHRNKLTADGFQESNVKWLFETLVTSHNKNAKSLNINEFKALHYAYNPAATTATKKSLDVLFDEIDKVNISSVVADDLVVAQYKFNKYTELTQLAMDGGDNKDISITKLREILDDISSADSPKLAAEEYITDDIDELFGELSKEYKWKFPEPLTEITGGIGEGVFALITARPNIGKTAFCAAIACMPGGFISQGARVHYLGVEEKSVRTKMRAMSSYTGWTKEYISEHRNETAKQWSMVRDNFKLKDVVGMDLTELEEYVKIHDIDILIIDQLDKIKVSGSFSGNHDKFGHLYVSIREIAKRYDIAIIGVCQSSNDAEGKLHYGMECLAESKTSKGAELDLCICIGADSFGVSKGEDSGFRMANVVKNKLTGIEKAVGFMLNKNLSRIQV